VSGFVDFDRLHPATRESIGHQADADDDKPGWPSKGCGCHKRGKRGWWWLCEYHGGFEDGAEAAAAAGDDQ